MLAREEEVDVEVKYWLLFAGWTLFCLLVFDGGFYFICRSTRVRRPPGQAVDTAVQFYESSRRSACAGERP